MHHQVNINVIIYSTCTRADAEMGSHNPKMSGFLPYLPQYNLQEANCAGKTEEAVLWGVSICLDPFLWGLLQLRECYQCFGQDTVVAIVGEPRWLALIPRAAVQTTSAPVPPQSAQLLWLGGDTPAPGFPWESGAAIPRLSNTQSKPGELQLWCVGKSRILCWVKIFPTSGLSV